ncbi:MAG: helix-turn-helix domain-containing protein [Halieaceae bacterium]
MAERIATGETMEPPIETKGQRTARRIMDVAETLFAQQGYEGTTLRQIAAAAKLQEPGLYNHFDSKQALYEAILHRGLHPMLDALSRHLAQAADLRDYTDLPAVMTDLLLDHPQMAALFQQAMQGEPESVGNQMVQEWLKNLFGYGIKSMSASSAAEDTDARSLAINVIAMFNLTTGYFLSQRAFNMMAEGSLVHPDNVARQKRLLRRVIRAMLIS